MENCQLLQMHYESATWKRLIDFISDENVRLKWRLSDILNIPSTDTFLQQMEDFQNRFVGQDELISGLRLMLSEIDQLLADSKLISPEIKFLIGKKLPVFRMDINLAEVLFSQLKFEFISCLSDKSPALMDQPGNSFLDKA